MSEIVKINWILLTGPLLCTSGIAILLTLAAQISYLKYSRNVKPKLVLNGRGFKFAAIVSIILIILGIILFQFRLDSGKLITVRVTPAASPKIELWPKNDIYFFQPSDLLMDFHNSDDDLNNLRRRNNIMTLLWDGFIQTPFILFDRGQYVIDFEAMGSKAENEFSKIKVELESPNPSGYLVSKYTQYIELSETLKPYRVNFDVKEPTQLGRVRITFFNDLYIEHSDQGRDVKIKNVELRRL